MSDSTNGKGDKQRPLQVTRKKFTKNWNKIFGSKPMTQTAEERGMEMMHIPTGQLPPIALDFGNKMCHEMGMCGEVLLTAWTVYAQCVEGLECTDVAYEASPSDVKWFAERSAMF